MRICIKYILMLLLFFTSFVTAELHSDIYINPVHSINDWLDKPIEISEKSGVIEAITADWFLGLSLKDPDNVEDVIEVNNCRELMSAYLAGRRGINYREQLTVVNLMMVCHTLEIASKLEPAKVSYLDNIVLDMHFAKISPASLGLQISREDIEKASKLETWNDFGKFERVKVRSEHSASYYDHMKGIQNATIVATGDFDGDGIEDLVLYVSNSLIEGSYRSYHIYVLTRDSEGAKLILIDEPNLLGSY
ncbi:FG-GAP repeat protein [Thaumasiovibrio sp. DFM-14]|uniref:FG-GAP repeat protein n=1 Tax=Thaumasiovibrio sp. DFM-14 TaxID=3384792 RepID=UPI0039A3C4A6